MKHINFFDLSTAERRIVLLVLFDLSAQLGKPVSSDQKSKWLATWLKDTNEITDFYNRTMWECERHATTAKRLQSIKTLLNQV